MKSYIITLFAAMLISHLIIKASPKSGRTTVRFICSLSVILTLISPVKSIAESVVALDRGLKGYITEQRAEVKESEYIASTVMRYVAENFSVSDGMRCVVVEEGGETVEIQLYIDGVTPMVGEKIEAVLGEKLGCEVGVFGEGGENEDGR